MSKLTANEELLIEIATDNISDIDYDAIKDKRKKCKYTGEEFFDKVYEIIEKLVKKVNKKNAKEIEKLEFTIETMVEFAKTRKEMGE